MEIKELNRIDLIFSHYTTSRYQVLAGTLKKSPDEILDMLMDSGLKGRGNAGFPTGLKWKFARRQSSDIKYVICNANESEPGTFKDKEILEKVPRKVLSGMAICAYCTGAREGWIYLRNEYSHLVPSLNQELGIFHTYCDEYGLDFRVKIFIGGGSYVSGEESALIASLMGYRAEPANKPPFPTTRGLNGRPTVVNNVETFATAQIICRIGSEEYKKIGTDDSRGSKLFSVSGDTPRPGVHELELGMTLADFVAAFGDGDTKAVQVGGASGYCIPRRRFGEVVIGFEGIPTGGSMILFNHSRSMYQVLHEYLRFLSTESCGLCTPCRVGTQQLLLGIVAVKNGSRGPDYLDTLRRLALTMKSSSKCSLGQSAANPFISVTEHFKEEIIY